MKLRVEMIESFFDKPAVTRALDRGLRKALGKIGGIVRRIARASIKNSPTPKASSAQGEPPLSHTGQLKDFIYYAYDAEQQDVIIGPARLNTSLVMGRTVPELLEFGGTALRYIGRGRKRRAVPYKMAPRPYMSRALENYRPRIPKEFQGIIQPN
jgi:hypothetical protein